MAIELTPEEKAKLEARQRLRAAQAEFGQRVEMDTLALSSRKKLRKGKAAKRARYMGKWAATGFQARDAQTKRIDRYIASEKAAFFKSRLWQVARYQALKRSEGRCETCGASPDKDNPLQVDHIKPFSKHPHLALALSNLQVLCRQCNMGKGAWDETDWRKATLGE